MTASVLRRIASYLREQTLAVRSTPHNPDLRVSLSRGRARLDAGDVNYSHGALHDVLAEAFRELGVGRRAPRRALLLGLGAGSAVRILREELRLDCAIRAVEIDPVVVELARAHFGLGPLEARGAVEVVVEDARAFVEREDGLYDLVVSDVFVGADVPPRCRDDAYVRLVAARLAPGGLLVVNEMASGPDGLVRAAAFAARFRAVLAGSRALPIGENLVLAYERAAP